MPKQFCKTCGKKCEGEYCFWHKPRKPLVANVSSLGEKLIVEEKSSMREFFVSIWKKRPHRSEVSGDNLGKEPLSVFFHHILPKEKYKDAALDEENIILLTLDEHTNVENDMYRYEEVNKRRNYLKTKYNIQ
jgi:hypothetical protein